MLRPGLLLVVGLASAMLASATLSCAKADEPKAPAPASSGASASTEANTDGGEVDAAGALRALPMPQQFPRVVWDAAGADAARGR